MATPRFRALLRWKKWSRKDWAILGAGFAFILFFLSFASDGYGEDSRANVRFQPAPRTADLVDLTLLRNAKDRGAGFRNFAVCLDGSLPGYHFLKGFGSGSSNWVLHIEGGGWCDSVASCSSRKTTSLGSSKFMETKDRFAGILSRDPLQNPDFFNWNKVKIRYCDGASFSGNPESEMKNGPKLYFRGNLIWEAVMDELLAAGLSKAKNALLSGCSAGGLAALIHCDDFRMRLPNDATAKCLADAGFFLDDITVTFVLNDGQAKSVNVPIGMSMLRAAQANDIELQGWCRGSLVCGGCHVLVMDAEFCNKLEEPTEGENDVLNLVVGMKERVWQKLYTRIVLEKRRQGRQCFFPVEVIKNIRTPVFIVNPAYDFWQIQHILAPDASDPAGYWQSCKLNIRNCNHEQLETLHEFRSFLLKSLDEFQQMKGGGMFINSCFIHCQTWFTETWHSPTSPRINNKTIAEAVGDWYFDRQVTKLIDCPYPCNPTCFNMDFTRGRSN